MEESLWGHFRTDRQAAFMINIGLIGYGHWGPDLARIFNGQVDSLVVAVADPDERRLAAAQDQIPFVSATLSTRR